MTRVRISRKPRALENRGLPRIAFEHLAPLRGVAQIRIRLDQRHHAWKDTRRTDHRNAGDGFVRRIFPILGTSSPHNFQSLETCVSGELPLAVMHACRRQVRLRRAGPSSGQVHQCLGSRPRPGGARGRRGAPKLGNDACVCHYKQAAL